MLCEGFYHGTWFSRVMFDSTSSSNDTDIFCNSVRLRNKFPTLFLGAPAWIKRQRTREMHITYPKMHYGVSHRSPIVPDSIMPFCIERARADVQLPEKP